MTTRPDEFDFQIERSRAAVTIACLEWLRCKGPLAEVEPTRVTSPDVVRILIDSPVNLGSPNPFDPPHPLWDRWIDG
jgi:hypothetical protein